MSILSGFKKFKRYIKTASGYILDSEWTNATTVEFNDGTTVQNNCGAIKGITDSLASTSSNIALSAKAGNDLNASLACEKSSSTTSGGILRKQGKDVKYRINFPMSGVVGYNFYTNKFVIPDGYRPTDSQYIHGVIINANSVIQGSCLICVSTDGYVHFESTISHNSAFSYVGSGSWFTP